MRTIKDLDDAGMNLRVWCYWCGRGTVLDSIVWMKFNEKGWPIDLMEARERFRCSHCKSRRDILLVAARREPEKDWSSQVHEWFFANRKGKRLFSVQGGKRKR